MACSMQPALRSRARLDRCLWRTTLTTHACACPLRRLVVVFSTGPSRTLQRCWRLQPGRPHCIQDGVDAPGAAGGLRGAVHLVGALAQGGKRGLCCHVSPGVRTRSCWQAPLRAAVARPAVLCRPSTGRLKARRPARRRLSSISCQHCRRLLAAWPPSCLRFNAGARATASPAGAGAAWQPGGSHVLRSWQRRQPHPPRDRHHHAGRLMHVHAAWCGAGGAASQGFRACVQALS